MYRVKLHTKFIALLIGVSLVPLLIVSGVTLIRYQQTLLSGAEALGSQLANTAAAEIRTFVVSQFDILESVAAIYNPDFPINAATAGQLTNIILLRSENFADISVTDVSGREVMRVNRVKITTSTDLRDRSADEAFQAVKASGVYIGPVYVIGGRPFFDIGLSINDVHGVFAAAAFAQVDARVMPSVVQEISKLVEPPGRVYVVNEHGVVVAHPDISYVLAQRDLSELPVVRDVVSGGKDNTATYQNENGDTVFGSGHPVTVQLFGLHTTGSAPTIHWFVVAEQPESAVFAEARQAAEFSLIVSFIAVLLALGAAIYFAGLVSHPIVALHHAAIEFGKGNLSYRAKVETGDEIGDLAQSFNNTAGALSDTVASLKSAEKETAEERNKLQLILSSVTNGVVAIDPQGAIILFNHAAELLTGLSSPDVLGKQLRGLISLKSAEKVIDVMDFSQEKGSISDPQAESVQMISRDGREHFVTIISDRIRDGEIERGFVFTFQDITREFIMDRTKHEFVSIAAHQLRTPLTGLSWIFESIGAGSAEASPQKTLSQQGLAEVRNMVDLVNDLLDLSQIEEGRFGIKRAHQSIMPLFERLPAIGDHQPTGKKINITMVIPPDLPELDIDAHKIQFVLTNLVDNACKYTPSGGTVTVLAKVENKALLIEVKDTGIGIPEEDKDRVFAKFFRAANALSFHPDGSGLGLYVAKNIVEQHGGRIWFMSEHNTGTTFYMTLPLS